ncbi:hypothetical protein DPMN_165649 [Dreissena polymorpha]|uniref:Uncharacterized protein n=1 Tax=Dreissena polymorpha TaxID=45954 RepID=A0A9D4EVQ5_DREPO|nr:hypothetical protein DPMN_165649 [Dreissena polymorpha]
MGGMPLLARNSTALSSRSLLEGGSISAEKRADVLEVAAGRGVHRWLACGYDIN